MIGYVAKDKNGEIYLHPELPHYEEEYEGWFSTPDCLNITGKFSEFDNIDYEDEPIRVIIKLKTIMSGKTDSAENMLNGIKSYKELDSIQKIARKYDNKRKCTNCNYKGLCPNDVLIVCMQSFEKGFVTGVKHHRKIVKSRK